MPNSNLIKAKQAKNDEFYTQFYDIEREVNAYTEYDPDVFRDKVVYCNCDDPRVSKFFHYFFLKFKSLGLKALITTCYKNQNPDMFSQNNSEKAIYLKYKRDKNGKLIPYPEYMKMLSQEPLYRGYEDNPNMPKAEDIGIGHLKGDGDFRSEECIEWLKQADVVVTNPPFSLFREYVAQLVKYDKKFLIIGSMNAITYKEVFKLIKENKVWLGNKPMGVDMLFDVPDEFAKELIARKKQGSGYKIIDGVVKGRSQAIWFTNLDHGRRHRPLMLMTEKDVVRYSTKKPFDKYDNYDAIEVSKVKDIPSDYAGVMGVPISFLDKYSPEQFEILGIDRYVEDNPNYGKRFRINSKEVYARILIKKKNRLSNDKES